MSFYGRIDHVADNISFVTDKIYDNRWAMDQNASTDTIYVGRYVLIEYGQNEDYDVNYNIDKQHYPGMGRGYDSTVWQKVFVNNVAKYVMVAELNSVVPTLDLTVDAPTHEPVVPHFDSDSNPVYYKLHVQPNWGFRVKNANKQTETSDGKEYPSDIKVKHQEQVYNPDRKEYDTEAVNYNGAIYFNSKGFNSSTKYKSSGVNDEISLTPTGKSGNVYNTHNQNDPTERAITEDIQELIVMLPSVGNAVSDLWDIIYNNPGQGKKRNKNVSWGSYQGVRMFTTSDSGYSYEPTKSETIAGAINTVHDLMGMIIDDQYKDAQEPLLESSSTDKIYYVNNKFYIKEKGLDWVEAKEGVSPYKEILLIDRYEKDRYYIKNLNKDFEVSTDDEVRAGVAYYQLSDIEPIGVILEDGYEPGIYYYLTNGNYKIDTSESYNKNRTYYKDPNEEQVVGSNKNYFFVKQKHTEISPGKYKGLFYHVEGENDVLVPVPCDENTEGDSFNLIKDASPFIGTYTKTQEWSESEQDIVTIYNIESKITHINLIEYNSKQKYYQKDGSTYVLLNGIPDNYYHTNPSYYTVNFTKIEQFYEPNKYYYLTPNDQKNYRWASGAFNNTYTYYTLTANGPYQYFYEPNKYYYQNNNKYLLDTNESITSNRTYYRYSELYVHPNNQNSNFINGSLWNTNLNKEDYDGLVLGYQYDDWQWKELKGFARSLNTIHGLIIELNNILKLNDFETRDTATVQGCINKLNDIIWKFETLVPNNLAIVNENGQIASAPLSGDIWINATVNERDNGTVVLTHTGPADMTHKAINNATPRFGDSFTITDWTFDSKGHKANSGTHTVTIPKGRLKDESEKTESNVLTALGFVPEVGEITTTRTNISQLKLAGYAKKTDNDNINSSDTLGAALSKLQTQIIEEKNARSDAINNLDAAENTSTTKFISTISQTDGKIAVERAAAGTLVLSDSTDAISAQQSDRIKGSDSIISAFGKVEAQIKAEADKRIDEVNILTEHLTEGIQDVKIAIEKETKDRQDAIVQEINDRKKAIQEESDARNRMINELNMSFSADNDKVITSISQVNGLVYIDKSTDQKKLGDIKLTGWTIGENTADNIAIADTDTVFNAFTKTQRQINANKNAIEVLNGSGEGSVSYKIAQVVAGADTKFDTLKEISDWIMNDDLGVAKINSDIATLYARNDGINKEVKENYIRKEELNNKLVEVNSEINTIDNKFDTKIKEMDNVLNTHTNDIETLYARNNGINKEVKENYVRKEDFNNTLTAIDTEFGIINLKYDTLSESIEKNNSDITTLYARNDGINKEVKENYIRKEDFEATVKMLLDKITALDNKVIELEKLINQ